MNRISFKNKFNLPLLSIFIFVIGLKGADIFLGLVDPTIFSSEIFTFPEAMDQWVQSPGKYHYRMRTNSMGIRYPEIPLSRPEGERRVVVLGDSFVEGMGVAEEKTFCHLLEKKYQNDGMNVRFINVGVSGAGPHEYWRNLLGVGARYEPSALMLFLYANDLEDMDLNLKTLLEMGEDTHIVTEPAMSIRIRHQLRRWFPHLYGRIKKIYFIYLGHINRHMGFIEYSKKDAERFKISDEKYRSWLKKMDREAVKEIDDGWGAQDRLITGLIDPRYWVKNLELPGPLQEKEWEMYQTHLQSILRWAKSRHIDLAIFFIPHPYQYNPDFDPMPQKMGVEVKSEWLSTETPIEKRISQWCTDQQVLFLNLTPLFRDWAGKGHQLHFDHDAHWNQTGHGLVFEALHDWLEESDFLK